MNWTAWVVVIIIWLLSSFLLGGVRKSIEKLEKKLDNRALEKRCKQLEVEYMQMFDKFCAANEEV